MKKAPNNHSVRPSDLHYKGKRIFIPAHKLGDHPGIVGAVGPGERYLANLAAKKELSFIPDDEVISQMCRDLAGELEITENIDVAFADPKIEFEPLDETKWDDIKYKADDPTAMDQGSIMFGGNDLGNKRFVCHVSEPFWFPEMPTSVGYDINNALRVKTSLYCNRCRGVQNFIPVVPYAAIFSIPKLWQPKTEEVMAELHQRLLTLFRESFEIVEAEAALRRMKEKA